MRYIGIFKSRYKLNSRGRANLTDLPIILLGPQLEFRTLVIICIRGVVCVAVLHMCSMESHNHGQYLTSDGFAWIPPPIFQCCFDVTTSVEKKYTLIATLDRSPPGGRPRLALPWVGSSAQPSEKLAPARAQLLLLCLSM